MTYAIDIINIERQNGLLLWCLQSPDRLSFAARNARISALFLELFCLIWHDGIVIAPLSP